MRLLPYFPDMFIIFSPEADWSMSHSFAYDTLHICLLLLLLLVLLLLLLESLLLGIFIIKLTCI